VSNVDRNTKLSQMRHSSAVLLVAALNMESHAVENLRQGAHADPTDAGEMDPSAGNNIRLDICVDMGHDENPSKTAKSRYLPFLQKCIIL